MARNMVMAVTVETVENIEGKDRIGLAIIKENGYKVIVSKADVHEGDVVIWFDSDSIIPDEEQYKFLRERCWKEKLAGYLIKTMRMGQNFSQGLIMTFAEVGIKPCRAGKDLTSILKVRKYEPVDDASPTDNKMPKWKKWLKNFLLSHNITRPLGKKLFLFNKGSGEFPVHLISKSDEDNIMLHQNWFDKYKNEKCVITVKMEGQSVTSIADKNAKKKFEFKCFGRNSIGRDDHYKYFNLKGLDKALVQYAEQNGLENIAIQGEWCASEGSGFKSVQGGPYRNGADFYVYKVNKNGKTVDWQDLVKTCQSLDLKTVPLIKVLEEGYGKIWNSVEEMQEASEHLWYKPGEASVSVYDDREQELHGKVSRHEGFVVCGYNKGDWSFKVKSQGYAADGIGKIKEL